MFATKIVSGMRFLRNQSCHDHRRRAHDARVTHDLSSFREDLRSGRGMERADTSAKVGVLRCQLAGIRPNPRTPPSMPGKSSSSIAAVLVFTAASSREARSPTAMSHGVSGTLTMPR